MITTEVCSLYSDLILFSLSLRYASRYITDLKLELTLRIPVQYALHRFLDFLFKTAYVVNITATIIRVYTSCSIVEIYDL